MPGKTLYFYPRAHPLPPPKPGVSGPTQIIETRAEDWSRLKPLSNWVLIELSTVPEKTEGGVILPDRMRESWSDGTVLAVGPGLAWWNPGGKEESGWKMPMRALPWADEGQIVLFQAHHFRPISQDKRIGMVRDDNLVGIYLPEEDEIMPLNGWVRVRQDETPLKEGSLFLSEEWAPKPMRGTVEAIGPGKLKLSGPLYGFRQPLDERLVGAHVAWGATCEILAVGRERLECLFLEATELECADA